MQYYLRHDLQLAQLQHVNLQWTLKCGKHAQYMALAKPHTNPYKIMLKKPFNKACICIAIHEWLWTWNKVLNFGFSFRLGLGMLGIKTNPKFNSRLDYCQGVCKGYFNVNAKEWKETRGRGGMNEGNSRNKPEVTPPRR